MEAEERRHGLEIEKTRNRRRDFLSGVAPGSDLRRDNSPVGHSLVAPAAGAL